MIKSFKSKELEDFFNEEKEIKGIDNHELKKALTLLNSAYDLRDLKVKSLDFQWNSGYYSIKLPNGQFLKFKLVPSAD